VPVVSPNDQRISDQLREVGLDVSAREVRTLRDYGVIETCGPGGGRGKQKDYVPGTAAVVAKIEQAKADDTYARKLHRAVLIAWARGAGIGTDGLRWAFHEHYEAEDRSDRSLLEGKRFHDSEPDLRFGPALNRAIAAARLGYPLSSEQVGEFEQGAGEVIRVAFWRSGQRQLLPVDNDRTSLGLAERRADGTWRVLEVGDQFWEALSRAPERLIARTAPREELEAALPHSRSALPAHGFQASDLVVACGVPHQVQWMRRWNGDNWWRSSTGLREPTPAANRKQRRESPRGRSAQT
jgi:hypothetical protein